MLKPRFVLPGLALLPVLAAASLQPSVHAVTVPTAPGFSQIIIFGDSLSDTGNDADVADDDYGIRFPGPDAYNDTVDAGEPDPAIDYTDGRFTDGNDTDPAAVLYSGVWHEQLATLFLGMKAADPSMDGGTDYAYGGAVTGKGKSTLSEEDGAVSLKIKNIGRQVASYLDDNPAADPKALYIVWGGANDLFNVTDTSTYTATADTAADNITSYVQRLAEAGAATFIVPNLPPLGDTPDYNTDATAAAAITAATQEFVNRLNTDLDNLQATLSSENLTPTINRLDVFSLFQKLVANPTAYGFDNVTQPSQTTDGAYPDRFLFWDGVHPTTAGHFQLAAEAYTLLSGIPVVEVNYNSTVTGVLVTRTGTDVSTSLTVNYQNKGTAVPGTDYVPLPGVVTLAAGVQTVEVDPQPIGATEGTEYKFKLQAEPTYARPVVFKVKFPIGAVPAPGAIRPGQAGGPDAD